MSRSGLILAFAGALGLAACGGGSGDDGPGDLDGSPEAFDILQSDFDALLGDYDAALPTPIGDMPTVGSATYAGTAVYSDVDTDPNLIIANPTSASSVELTADFGSAAVGGRLFNFRSSNSGIAMVGDLDIVDGQITDNTFVAGIDGSLTIDGVEADHTGGAMIGSFIGGDAGAVGGPIVQGSSPTRYNGAFIAER